MPPKVGNVHTSSLTGASRVICPRTVSSVVFLAGATSCHFHRPSLGQSGEKFGINLDKSMSEVCFKSIINTIYIWLR